ncbi:hypothetical protein C7M52_03522 [Mixta theicola]|nr:DUF3304 domain-containing protein [Mixta theicola]QHM77523.1 hypothetical protein C7M52_03522 [Mixta theicola]
MNFFSLTLFGTVLLLSGCDGPQPPDNTASGGSGGSGAIEAINHTSWAINRFSVNDISAIDVIGPYQGGGGGGSYAVPPVWTPDLTVKVDWETGVAFASDVPEIPKPTEPDTTGMGKEARYKTWKKYAEKYYEWEDKIEAFSKEHSRTVQVPDYTGQKTCGITVHFLPCDRIKVTTSCADYGSPDYPIKDPVYMEKPAVCPQ